MIFALEKKFFITVLVTHKAGIEPSGYDTHNSQQISGLSAQL